LLPTILRTLEPLASSRALHLVMGLYISGALILLSPDDRLLIPFFLLQRSLVIVLLWSNIGLPLVTVSSAASVAVGLIYLITVWRLYREASPAVAQATRRAQPLTNLPLRALAVALALLLTYGLVQRYAPPLLPPLVTWSVAWLLSEFCFAQLLAPTPLHAGLGVLAFADAGRILYALTRPDPLIWGMWAVCDVLVALAAAHLRTVEVTTYGGVDSQRRPRRGIWDILKPRLAPISMRGIAQPEETISTQEPYQVGTDTSMLATVSAVETEPSGPTEPKPEPGGSA
jgi:hypothetical protein